MLKLIAYEAIHTLSIISVKERAEGIVAFKRIYLGSKKESRYLRSKRRYKWVSPPLRVEMRTPWLIST